MKRTSVHTGLLAGALVVLLAGLAAAGPHFSPWSPAQKIDDIGVNSSELNTTSLDGCPIQSPDGLSLYMASNRPGSVGLDIWVARRASTTGPWGTPENLGAPVNSPSDDFCPTPIRGGGLLFVSRKVAPGTCGMGDIYLTRFHPVHGWQLPQHLGCAPDGPNTSLDEQGPSYVDADGRQLLYFSSGPDIFVSERGQDGSFGPGQPVAELNGAASDVQPNVRKDGREIVFASNDPDRPGALGGFDVYTSTRDSIDDPFAPPVNLGGAVNTGANETRPSFSWDALTMLFGRAPGPEGMTDIYITTRGRES